MSPSSSSKRYTILYVDDESENLTGFKFLFRRYYRVLLTTSGDEALEILKKEEVQLVLADQRMPKMTGATLLAKVAQLYPYITRIIVTGYSDIEGVVEAVNKGGIYYYVTKPWNAEELKMIIDRALEAYQLRIDKKKLIDDLKDSNTELDTFLYRSAHDLRRPISTMLGLAKVAKLSLHDTEALDLFERIEETAEGMGALLRKLYMVNDLTIDEDDIPEERYSVIDIEELVNTILKEFEGLIKEKEVSIELQLDAGIHHFTSDRLLLRNILFNLIENSLVFTKEGRKPCITIRIFQQQDKLNIEIHDNGIGILEKYIPTVFNMYVVGSEQTLGSGLGLYVVKRSTEVLNGHVSVSSVEGEGTVMRLEIPFTAGESDKDI